MVEISCSLLHHKLADIVYMLEAYTCLEAPWKTARHGGSVGRWYCLLTVPAAKRWQQPWQRWRRTESGKGAERPTTVSFPVVAAAGRRDGGGRLHSLAANGSRNH